MIIINQETTNNICLTLTEKVSLTNPYFLFEFENDTTKEKKYFIASDDSFYPYRYNKFSIKETLTPDSLNGEVTLTCEGSWSYTVREQESSSNLDPLLSGAIVETGKVKVIGATSSEYVYNSNDSKVVYNG